MMETRNIADEADDSDVALLLVTDGCNNDGSDGGDVELLQPSSDAVERGTETEAVDSVDAVDRGLHNASVQQRQFRNLAPGSQCENSAVQTSDVENSNHRHRRHSRHRRSGNRRHRHRLCRFKKKEANYLSATFNMIVIVLMCVAIIEPRWFYVQGGRCSDSNHASVDYLGLKLFFYQGVNDGFAQHDIYHYGSNTKDVLLECVNHNVIFVMRTIIALCLFVIIFSLVACILDLLGPTHFVCRAIRSTASLSILSACTCIVTTGLCYLVTQQLAAYYDKNKFHATSKIDVQFNVGFYMITAAGAVSIISVACSLMRVRVSSRRSWSHGSSSDRRRIIEADIERLDAAASACTRTNRRPPPYQL